LGCLACLLGTYLIGLGEEKGENEAFTIGTFIGICFGKANSFFTAGIIMSSKYLLISYDTYELNFTLGVYIAFFAFFFPFFNLIRYYIP